MVLLLLCYSSLKHFINYILYYLHIRSLIDNTSHAILHPKQPFVGGKNSTWSSLFTFSDCGKYLAVVHRIELQDHIGIYSTDPWAEQTKFKCKSNDVASINWVPNGTHIVTCDSPLSYKFCIYTPSGEVVGNYEAYHNALGIKNLTFYSNYNSNNDNNTESANSNISSNLMAVGSYDGKIRLITMQSSQVAFILPLTHPRDMDAGIVEDPTIGAEVTVEINETSSEISVNEKLGEKTEKGFPRKKILAPIYVKKFMKTLPRISIDARDNKSLPPMGPSWCSWSADGSYFACREESYPKVLWIWDSNKPRLIDIILQAEPITCAQWKPSTNSNSLLAFCTGSNRIYLWSVDTSVSWIDLPSSSASALAVSWLKWSNDGARIVMGGRESFCTGEVEV